MRHPCHHFSLLSTFLYTFATIIPTFTSALSVEEACASARHIHLSSKSDASTSITISFSSHLCDIKAQQQQKSIHQSNHNIENNYDDYKYMKSSIAGVVLSSDRAKLTLDEIKMVDLSKSEVINETDQTTIHKFITNDMKTNEETKGLTRRYNTTIHLKYRKIEYWSEYQHHFIFTDLKPDTKYYYRCIMLPPNVKDEILYNKTDKKKNGDLQSTAHEYYEYEEYSRKKKRRVEQYHNKDNDNENILSFKTAPSTKRDIRDETGAEAEVGTAGDVKVKFALVGDLGVFQHSKETLKFLATKHHDIDFVILAGDISYANGDHRIWDKFFDMIDETKLFTKKPLYTAVGNHDVETNIDTGEMFMAYESRFLMPQIAKAEIGRATSDNDFDLNKMYQLPYDYGNSYYSFTYGTSHNIVLNAFADFEPGSKQYEWLVYELSIVDRDLTPWLTVTVHCPLYTTFKQHHNDPQPINLKRFLEPLFVIHKVNFVLSGHLHGYSRTHPVAFNNVTDSGPIHFVLGNGGRQANAPFLNPDPEEWIAMRDHTTYGFGVIEYINMTTARYEWCQTGQNIVGDKGKNVLNAPDNLTDVVYIHNQYYM